MKAIKYVLFSIKLALYTRYKSDDGTYLHWIDIEFFNMPIRSSLISRKQKCVFYFMEKQNIKKKNNVYFSQGSVIILYPPFLKKMHIAKAYFTFFSFTIETYIFLKILYVHCIHITKYIFICTFYSSICFKIPISKPQTTRLQ